MSNTDSNSKNTTQANAINLLFETSPKKEENKEGPPETKSSAIEIWANQQRASSVNHSTKSGFYVKIRALRLWINFRNRNIFRDC